jgi:hypothetical protein
VVKDGKLVEALRIARRSHLYEAKVAIEDYAFPLGVIQP